MVPLKGKSDHVAVPTEFKHELVLSGPSDEPVLNHIRE